MSDDAQATDSPGEAAVVAELINTLGAEFDQMTQERHLLGEKKYGPGKFLRVNTMQEALFELLDLANYAKYTYIKIRLLEMQLQTEPLPPFTKTLDPNQS